MFIIYGWSILGDRQNLMNFQKTITQNASTINYEYSKIFITYVSMLSQRIGAELCWIGSSTASYIGWTLVNLSSLKLKHPPASCYKWAEKGWIVATKAQNISLIFVNILLYSSNMLIRDAKLPKICLHVMNFVTYNLWYWTNKR